MTATLLSVQSLLLGMSVLLAGSGLLSTLLGLRAQQGGMGVGIIGIVMAGFYVGYLIGAQILPKWIHRIGHIRVFAALAALSSVSALLSPLWIDPVFWFVLRVVSGFALLGLYMVIESWLNGIVHSHRGQVFGFYMMLSLVALGAGQFLIGWHGVGSDLSFLLAGLLFAAGLIPVALTSATAPASVNNERLSILVLYRLAPTGLVGSALSGLITGAIWALAAVYAQEVGLGESQAAGFVAALVLGGALLQWPIGRWSDRQDRRLVLIWLGLLGVVSAIALGGVAGLLSESEHRTLFMMALAALFGGLAFAIYAISVAQTHDRLSRAQTLEATRTLLWVNGLGALIGPLLTGGLMHWLGSVGFLSGLILALTLLAFFTLWRLKIDAPVAKADRQAFVPTTRTSAEAVQLDPRTPDVPPNDANPSTRED